MSCSDAAGTGCNFPYSLAYRAFGLNPDGGFSRLVSEAATSLSLASLTHLQYCVTRVLEDQVEGHMIEAGVFRGGAVIFMAGLLAALDKDMQRNVYVADSFAGIPKSRSSVSEAGECDDWVERYEVSEVEVKNTFRRYGLLDNRVKFVKGQVAEYIGSSQLMTS